MRVNALLALGACAALSKADIGDDIAAAVDEASSSAGSVVESVTSSAVSKPTFTVSRTRASPWTTFNIPPANDSQGTLLGAIHRRLGGQMACFPCKEGEHRGGMGLRWHMVRRGAYCP